MEMENADVVAKGAVVVLGLERVLRRLEEALQRPHLLVVELEHRLACCRSHVTDSVGTGAWVWRSTRPLTTIKTIQEIEKGWGWGKACIGDREGI